MAASGTPGRRPTPPHARTRIPHSRSDESGAVVVLGAFLMVVMLGFGAIVVDAGALYAERRQLQNGADAAALAVAMDCAAGDCGDTGSTAGLLADANANDGAAGIDEVEVLTNRVVVDARTRTPDGGSAITHWIAPLFGVDETGVGASASADWGGPSAGTAVVPLAMSWCTFEQYTGGGVPSGDVEQTVYYLDPDDEDDCLSPSGHSIPGGFGWLEPDDGSCAASSSIEDDQTPGKPGVSTPTACQGTDFAELRDETVLLPLFEEAGGQGSSGWFKIHAYAAFHVTGYRFACPPEYRWNDGGGSCGPNTARFVRGYFTQIVTLDDAFQLGGPDVGALVVALTR